MFTSETFSKQRLVVYDLLNRAKRNHCTVTGAFEWDVTDTLTRISAMQEAGDPISLTSFMVKATATILERHPRLNDRVFYGLRGPRRVRFGEISCNLVLLREGKDGKQLIMPVVLRHVDQRSIHEISQEIHDLQTQPLEALAPMKMRTKLKRVPRLALRFFDYKVTTDPGFYEKRFGTYALSALLHHGSGAIGGTPVTTQTCFYPTNIQERPVVRDGEIVIRQMMLFGLAVDHFIVDGLESLTAARELKSLIEDPSELLGPE
jgi:pyruvate/2-oxoglutarate dehydrogenase complex dihydrolipoamide acyltransferase (E2) component